jgi:competence protein ComEC
VSLAKAISFFSNICKPPRQPMLWAALAYASGIIVGVYAWRPPLWWVIAAVAFLMAALYFAYRRWWLGFPLALGTLFFVGALAIQLRNARPAAGQELAALATGEEVTVTGRVIHSGQTRSSGLGGLRQTIDVATEEISTDEQTQSIQGGIHLNIYAKEPEQEYDEGAPVPMRVYHYGERLRFTAKLRAPRNFRNPGAFDYRGYLADHGIAMLASTKSAKVEVLPGFVGTQIECWRERVHRSIVRKIHALWSPEDAALMDAAVVGESTFLAPSTRVDFQRSGTYHILVVSGMNVSILAFVIFWTMRRLRLSDFLASALTVMLCTA